MTPEELLQDAVSIARRLCSESRTFETDGAAIAAQFDEPVESDALYHALFEANRRGLINCYFPGGMELPDLVRMN